VETGQLLLAWEAPSWLMGILNVLVLLIGIFLVFVILIQRGKGGGLAGAFGGVGGSSAFGSRAGDTFTRITIGVAAVWVIVLMVMAAGAPTSKSTREENIPKKQPAEQPEGRRWQPPGPSVPA